MLATLVLKLHALAIALPASAPQWALVSVLLFLEWLLPRTKSIRANSLIEAAANTILKIPAVGALIKVTPLIGDVMQYLGTTTPNAPYTTAVPQSTPPATPPSPPAALFIPLLFLPFATACATVNCDLPVNASNPQCEAKAVAQKCALPAVVSVVESIMTDVTTALLNNNYSQILTQIETNLKNQGETDAIGIVTCAVENIALNKNMRADTSNNDLATIQAHASAWLAGAK